MTIAFIGSADRIVVDVPRQLTIVVVVAALLAGCGGGAKVERQRYATAAAFAVAANGVCRVSRTRGTRLARLHRLVPPVSERSLFDRWLKAEQSALDADREIAQPSGDRERDPRVQLAIAEGKVAGYARRLGADACAASPGVTIRP
jgi:hypothetical protein